MVVYIYKLAYMSRRGQGRGTPGVRARENQTPGGHWYLPVPLAMCVWLPSNIYPQRLQVHTVPPHTLSYHTQDLVGHWTSSTQHAPIRTLMLPS
jgi:hypothetical protein